MLRISHSSLPQSACFEPAVFCTGPCPPECGNRVQHVQLSALPQPKCETEIHNIEVKGYKVQKIAHVSSGFKPFLEEHSDVVS